MNVSNPVSSVKLTNALKKELEGYDYDMKFKNIRINGSLRGCSGFITNKANNVTVYIDTERGVYLNSMYCRYALNQKDYTGTHNNLYEGLSDLVSNVKNMLDNEQAYKREIKSWKHIDLDADKENDTPER